MAATREGSDETSPQITSSLAAASEGAREGGGPSAGAEEDDVEGSCATSVKEDDAGSDSGTKEAIATGMGFTIHVGSWKGMKVTLRGAKGADSVGGIKERMRNEEGTPADRQILLLDERELEDDRTLDYYNVKKGCYLDQRCRRYVCNLRL